MLALIVSIEINSQYGILYAPFKYGLEHYVKDGRFFNCCDESSIIRLIKGRHEMELVITWITQDQRINRKHE